MRYYRLLLVFILFWGLAPIFAGENQENQVDPNLVVILSDIHVGANPNKPAYAAVPEVKLDRTVDQILAMNPRPVLVLHYGDISYNDGTKVDYEMLKPILARLDDAGIPWVTTFGNHDRRDAFWSVFPEKHGVEEFPEKLVAVAQTDRAVFILLDSLVEGNVSTLSDPAQLQWLDEKLQSLESTGKHVYVGAHHPLNRIGAAEIIKKHPNVAGFIFGHEHYWNCETVDGIPCIGLPSTAYIACNEYPEEVRPLGYVTLRLGETEDVFTFHSRLKHQQDGQNFTVTPLCRDGAAGRLP